MNKIYESLKSQRLARENSKKVVKEATENGLTIENGVVVKADKDVTNVVIPDGVKEIGNDAFEGCESLKSVTIPDSVTRIGKNAFFYKDSLTSVTIGNSVTSIGNSAFSFCKSLMSITIPDSVTSIEEAAFQGCESLKSMIIPNRVTSIENYLFYGCYKLTSVTIPDSVTSIGKRAFCECTHLTSITIPSSVVSIEASAFFRCKTLNSINYEGTKDQWSKLSSAEDWVIIPMDTSTLVSNLGLKEGCKITCTDGEIVISNPNKKASKKSNSKKVKSWDEYDDPREYFGDLTDRIRDKFGSKKVKLTKDAIEAVLKDYGDELPEDYLSGELELDFEENYGDMVTTICLSDTNEDMDPNGIVIDIGSEDNGKTFTIFYNTAKDQKEIDVDNEEDLMKNIESILDKPVNLIMWNDEYDESRKLNKNKAVKENSNNDNTNIFSCYVDSLKKARGKESDDIYAKAMKDPKVDKIQKQELTNLHSRYRDLDESKLKSKRKKSMKESSLTRAADTDDQEEAITKVEKLLNKLGVKVRLGTKVGKYPQSVILDIRYQDNAVSVTPDGSVELYGEDIDIDNVDEQYIIAILSENIPTDEVPGIMKNECKSNKISEALRVQKSLKK